MIRLHVIAEGQTEQAFAREVLAPHLADFNIIVDARCIQTSNKHGHKKSGGLVRYSKLKNDLHNWMMDDQRPESRFTTMIDLYGLPSDFPGKRNVNMNEPDKYQLVEDLEHSFAAEFDARVFIPYIQLHEFEALLLAEPSKLADEFPEYEDHTQRLASLVASLGGNPELVNDGEKTAPSKRIIAQIPAYKKAKASSGPKVAALIGLSTLRAKCRHFGSWIAKLENL